MRFTSSFVKSRGTLKKQQIPSRNGKGYSTIRSEGNSSLIRPPLLEVHHIANSRNQRAIRSAGLLRVRLERRTVARIAGFDARIQVACRPTVIGARSRSFAEVKEMLVVRSSRSNEILAALLPCG